MKNNFFNKTKLSPGVAKKLENFILHTNLSFGGPINNMTWEALYELIRYAHAHRVRLGDDQMRDILMSEGAKPEDAEEIAKVYLHGRNLLYKKRPWDIQRMYSWLRSKKEKKKIIEEFRNNLTKQNGTKHITKRLQSDAQKAARR